jgi:hypothetical protein
LHSLQPDHPPYVPAEGFVFSITAVMLTYGIRRWR